MVYYIRFLKPPKITPSPKNKNISLIHAVIAVESDLSDHLYAGDLDLTTCLAVNPGSPPQIQKWTWKNGMRALQLQFTLQRDLKNAVLELGVFCGDARKADLLALGNIPEIVSLWSLPFGSGIGKMSSRELMSNYGSLFVGKPLGDGNYAPGLQDTGVMRRFDIGLKDGECLEIYEERGESMSRHIWDAGLGLIPWLRGVFQNDIETPAAALVREILSTEKRRVAVLELGSGVGIVGVALAQMRQKFDVWVSDKADATHLLGLNASNADYADFSGLTTTTIDWDEELLYQFQDMSFELILVCDCTYNTDSMPALVEKLREMAEISSYAEHNREPYVLVSTKVRHSSEAVFFDMMEKAAFVQLEHASVELPDRLRIQRGEALEVADIYIFQLKKGEKELTSNIHGEGSSDADGSEVDNYRDA